LISEHLTPNEPITPSPNLAVEIGGMRLKNPVMSASGCFGWGEEYARFWDLNRMGALVGKAVTPRPYRGCGSWTCRCG
jgi:dihydroorotate dehydrogenase